MNTRAVPGIEGLDLDRRVPVRQEYRDHVTEHGSSTGPPDR
ncbi:hypothetical protein ACFVS9_29985 [Streptomyces sp. NPDC058008]